MFFERRKWAARIIEKIGLPIRSPEATLLTDLLIQSAKEEHKILQSSGLQMPKSIGILMGGITMVHNSTAVSRVSEVLGIDEANAGFLLFQMKVATRMLAEEYGYDKIVELADRPRAESRIENAN